MEALDDGIAVLEIRVDRVVDTETDTTIILDGGIGSYVATLQFDSSCMTISASNQRGGGPFEPPVGLVRGNKLFLSQVNQSTTEQPAPVTVAKVVVQLTGSVNTSCDITLTDLRISDNPAQGLPVPVEQPGASSPEKSLIRGDANGDGTVDENDALFIAGLAVGLRAPGEEVGQVRPVQAAGVNPDGPGGDIPNSVDLLQILQYVVGVRDEFFNLI